MTKAEKEEFRRYCLCCTYHQLRTEYLNALAEKRLAHLEIAKLVLIGRGLAVPR